jgi:hypothetical protein
MWRTRKTSIVAGLLVAAFVACGTECEATGAPVVDSALGCVETTIATLHAPTGESMAAGGSITFRNDIAPGHGTQKHRIVGVYVPPDSYLTGTAGDRVRVCLISVPKKTEACDPAADERGRQFLIYDRALSVAMLFSNGEHDCGGA